MALEKLTEDQYYNYPIDEAETMFALQNPDKEFLDFYFSKPRDLGFFPTNVAQNPAMVNYGIGTLPQFDMANLPMYEKDDSEQEYISGTEPSGIAKLLQYLPFGDKSITTNLLRNLLPQQDPRASFMKNFYGSEYGLTPTGSVASGIMAGYNPVSGGFINRITGGKFGDPTTFGLQNAYEKRINRINKTLQDKYLSQGRSLDETELDERLAELERLKAEEFNAFKKFIESRAPQPEGLRDIGSAGIDKTIQTGGAAENKFTESEKKSIRSRDLTGGPGKDYGPFSRR